MEEEAREDSQEEEWDRDRDLQGVSGICELFEGVFSSQRRRSF